MAVRTFSHLTSVGFLPPSGPFPLDKRSSTMLQKQFGKANIMSGIHQPPPQMSITTQTRELLLSLARNIIETE